MREKAEEKDRWRFGGAASANSSWSWLQAAFDLNGAFNVGFYGRRDPKLTQNDSMVEPDSMVEIEMVETSSILDWQGF